MDPDDIIYDPQYSMKSRLAAIRKRDSQEDTHAEQPLPKRNDHPAVQDLVMRDMERRKAIGISRYGTALQPFNGRDSLRDLYEELLDACNYIRQLMYERDGT